MGWSRDPLGVAAPYVSAARYCHTASGTIVRQTVQQIEQVSDVGPIVRIAWSGSLRERCNGCALTTFRLPAMTYRIRALCLCMFLSGCVPTGPSEFDELRRNQERWQARQPATYEFVFQRSCECLPTATVPLLITVHERQIRSVVKQQTGEPVSAEVYQAKRIEDLFAIVEEALEQGAAWRGLSTRRVRFRAHFDRPSRD